MKRGDVVVAAAKGVYSGKPRPAVVIQTDILNEVHPSVILAPITNELRSTPAFRIPVAADGETGLRGPSEIMVDKLFAVPRENVGQVIGRLDADTRTKMDRALMLVLGLI